MVKGTDLPLPNLRIHERRWNACPMCDNRGFRRTDHDVVCIEWGADPEIELQGFTAIIQRAIDASHEWQPIETAPRDWTPVLLLEDGQPIFGSWFEINSAWLSSNARRIWATHWMRLRPPPKGDAA